LFYLHAGALPFVSTAILASQFCEELLWDVCSYASKSLTVVKTYTGGNKRKISENKYLPCENKYLPCKNEL